MNVKSQQGIKTLLAAAQKGKPVAQPKAPKQAAQAPLQLQQPLKKDTVQFSGCCG